MGNDSSYIRALAKVKQKGFTESRLKELKCRRKYGCANDEIERRGGKTFGSTGNFVKFELIQFKKALMRCI